MTLVDASSDKRAFFCDELTRATPSSVGISAKGICAFLDTIKEEKIELHSMMLYVDEKVVVEGWWAPYSAERPHMQHSVTKSFLATGVGIAVGEGLLKLSDKVTSFFPNELPHEITPRLANMTVEHLLTMSTGHGRPISGSVWRPIKSSWVREFFKEPIVNEPGSTFLYTSAASYMLSAILQKATGQTTEDYMRSRFFSHLGIDQFSWDKCPHGISSGGNGLSCTTSALLKLGALHLALGQWRGRRIVPEEWVKNATAIHIVANNTTEPHTGYGYQWWVLKDGTYFAWGVFGQYCVIMPQYNAVLAVTGGMEGQLKGPLPFINCLIRHLYPTLESRGSAQGCHEDDTALATRLANLRLLALIERTFSPLQSSLSGNRYAMKENVDGVVAITLNFQDNCCCLTIEDDRGIHSIEAGFGFFVESATSMTGNRLHHEYQMDSMKVFARAAWSNDSTLVITWQFVESAFRDTVVCSFEGNILRFYRGVNVNTGPLQRPTIEGFCE
jgi:CubicO group peptidase (beta-lactamase class C family)